MFKIRVEKNRDVAILRCIGRLIRGKSVSTLRKTVVSGTNAQTILLDLSEVEAIDAGGVNHWSRCFNGQSTHGSTSSS